MQHTGTEGNLNHSVVTGGATFYDHLARRLLRHASLSLCFSLAARGSSCTAFSNLCVSLLFSPLSCSLSLQSCQSLCSPRAIAPAEEIECACLKLPCVSFCVLSLPFSLFLSHSLSFYLSAAFPNSISLSSLPQFKYSFFRSSCPQLKTFNIDQDGCR